MATVSTAVTLATGDGHLDGTSGQSAISCL